MQNPGSLFEENAEALSSLVRPLAIVVVIALAVAATVCRPAKAMSRERGGRHALAGRVEPTAMRSSAKARSARARRESVRSRRVESTARRRQTGERAESSRRRGSRARLRSAVAERTGRRSLRREVAMRHPLRESVVVRHPEPLARPVAGANSIIEAAPGSVGAADPHAAANAAANTTLPTVSPGAAKELAEAAIQPRVTPMYTRTGRLIVPAPLRGSREILVHQNQMADAAGLERIENDEALDRLRYQHELIEVADTSALRVNPELPENRRFARPWTAKFAGDIARAYYSRFGQPLELNSAVRTISYQLRLQRVNGNAAAIEGETASPHLTGQAIDFGKKGMTTAQIAWMRMYLTPLMNAGVIDVEEEFQQACFHISVYRKYTGGATADLAETQSRAGINN